MIIQDIGNPVFFLQPKTKEILKGELIGINITEKGYVLGAIKFGDKQEDRIILEEAHIHLTEQDCIAHHDKVVFPMGKAEGIEARAVEEIQVLRIMVIGEPRFKELATRIMGT